MQVTIHAAKTNLSKLIKAAQAGEEVIIAMGKEPVAKLVPIEKKRFKFGPLEQLRGTEPDFLEPMSEEDLKLWEGGE
ncbi:MAG TPA: type II toxin-antitoxin system prevent-host-death family antitoxin [Mesorhizobium sp.]|jgi:prevent-host-death family protein